MVFGASTSACRGAKYTQHPWEDFPNPIPIITLLLADMHKTSSKSRCGTQSIPAQVAQALGPADLNTWGMEETLRQSLAEIGALTIDQESVGSGVRAVRTGQTNNAVRMSRRTKTRLVP